MSQIVIIHPGSLYLRIGKASDLNPEIILNCIARRRKNTGTAYQDTLLPAEVERTKEVIQELEDARLNVSHQLQNCLQSNGRKRYGTSSQQLSVFNRRVQPEIIHNPGSAQQSWVSRS